MYKLRYLLTTLFILFISTVKATTWDEPWHDKVVKEAESFVLAKVVSSDKDKGVTISILKQLGGKELTGTILISKFYALSLCSYSTGEGPEFHFEHIDSCYFFIKKNEKDEYCIATPTAGYAAINNGIVSATYRHSYHQARVTLPIYQQTMTAIFNNYHGLPYDKSFINDFINKYLALKPAGFDKEELPIFFNQHVALECIYHLNLTGFYDKIIPFLNEEVNFHSQVSAARALAASNTPQSRTLLLNILRNKKINDFVKVISIWTLQSYEAKDLKPQFQQLEQTASTEENGFGGNIMDPRICTHFPTVKQALDELIAKAK
ncbi:hypothetical protein ACFFGT_03200 [Mucilaginibacter angelicae]|uniref:Uncharacterized protein n=1 Tax=Mucilaginibacter angelicae TaxID=869718 RepID=A0ABV6L387_9SPHI